LRPKRLKFPQTFPADKKIIGVGGIGRALLTLSSIKRYISKRSEPEGVNMDENGFTPNNLADEEKSFIVPLMVVGIFFVVLLLAFGLFMPNTNWEF